MKTRTLCLLLVVALSGCTMFTKSGRQQRSYEKYVKKSSQARDRQKVKFRGPTDVPLRPMPSPATTEVSTEESPQSATTSETPPKP